MRCNERKVTLELLRETSKWLVSRFRMSKPTIRCYSFEEQSNPKHYSVHWSMQTLILLVLLFLITILNRWILAENYPLLWVLSLNGKENPAQRAGFSIV